LVEIHSAAKGLDYGLRFVSAFTAKGGNASLSILRGEKKALITVSAGIPALTTPPASCGDFCD
jgi:hypothetical protein